MQELVGAISPNRWLAGVQAFLGRPTACLRLPSLTAAVFFAGACFGSASAQTKVSVDNGSELRILYANSMDIAEGKRIVESSCAGCHGEGGVSENPGVPSLAGQRAAYMLLELKAYQSGARNGTVMNTVVAPLSEDALFKAAAYFASLNPPEVNGAGRANIPAVDPIQAGKTASAACAGCHGDTGTTNIPGTPSLSGQDPKFLVTAMNAYKSGQRQNETMKAMVGSVTEATANNIALFYALQKPQRAQTAAEGDKAAGSAATAACAGCHGSDGVSGNPAIPSLAGQDANYIATALQAYKEGTRSDETMKGVAASLDERAVKNIAAFYNGLEPKQPNVRKPLTAEEWAQRCDRCHGINGNSVDPRLPALAAQRQDYLEQVLQDYRAGRRKSPQMAAMSDVLAKQDISNLAAYYAHQTARGVVFVVLPPNQEPR